MDLNAEFPELEREIRSARTLDALDIALQKVEGLTALTSEAEYFGRKLFTPGLDSLAPHLASALRLIDDPRQGKSNDNVCVIATHLYEVGGHTRVAQDFVAGLPPEQKPFFILTSTWGGKSRYRSLLGGPTLRSVLGERAFMILSAATLVEKTAELYMMLKAARPSRVILLCHPFDIVAIVATWPFRDVVEFVHASDHVPALGATLPYSAHVDLTYTCHCACRAAGLDAVYSGMTSTIVGVPAHARAPGRLRLATCGDERKFKGAGLYRWVDYAIAALQVPGAELLHIGAMPEELQKEIHGALAAAGFDPERYVFAGRKPSLPAALVEHEIDVYVSSYPVPGGKANLEAMAVGAPVIYPVDENVAPLLHFRLPLGHSIEVNTPSGFAGAIARALDLGQVMRTPTEIANRDREFARFADYVSGRRPAPTALLDVLAE